MALGLGFSAFFLACMQESGGVSPADEPLAYSAAVTIPPPFLSLRVLDAPVGEFNLSSPPNNPFKILDWSHWGRTTATDWNHMNGGNRIGNFTKTGPAPQRYTNPVTSYSWNNGTPTLSETRRFAGVFIPGTGSNFRLNVKTDNLPKILYLFISAYKARGKLTVKLSDGSAPQIVNTTISSTTGNVTKKVEISFEAGSANQNLIIDWTLDQDFGSGSGNVTLQAAILFKNNLYPEFTSTVDPSSKLNCVPQDRNLGQVILHVAPFDLDGQVTRVYGTWTNIFNGVYYTGEAVRTAPPWDLTFPDVAGTAAIKVSVDDDQGARTVNTVVVPLMTSVYTGPEVPYVPIPDYTGPSTPVASMELPISGAYGTLSEIRCEIQIEHPFIGDLQVTLIHPDGTRVLLVNRVGGSGDNLWPEFVEGNPNSIYDAQAPFDATYHPDESFSKFYGKSPNGVWKLEAKDFGFADVGAIQWYRIDFKTR